MSGKSKEKTEPGFPIDFVLPWVDGSDPAWIREKNRYLGQLAQSSDDRDARYRDWGMLKYWFRGVEAFAPWANKIYFITCGHVPEWLNLNAPKLIHVKHTDYIPAEYLPTFSSHPIELNLHRIEALSEHFVYFNDDLFLLQPVDPDFFFRGELPVFPNEIQPVIARPGANGMASIYLNDVSVINSRLGAEEALRDKRKWFSLRTHSKRAVFYNLFFARYFSKFGFVGFRNPHFAVPTRKSTMQLLWEEEPAILDATSRHRFRDSRDVNQMLFRYWHYATNQFEPAKTEDLGRYYAIKGINTEKICKVVREQKHPQICLNDMDLLPDEDSRQEVQSAFLSAFEQLLPEKSSFEK